MNYLKQNYNSQSNNFISVKDIRMQLGYTQEEFAFIIGASQNYISKLEAKSKKIDSFSIQMLLNLSKNTNESIDSLLNNIPRETEKLNIDNYWENIKNEFEKDIKEYRKPTIVVMGTISSGKSSFINSILGNNFLPTSIGPKTKKLVHIIDSSYKPGYIQENCLIFKITNKEKIYVQDLLKEETYRNENKCIEKGNYEIIKKYGTVNNSITENLYYIVVFYSAPILKNADLVDTIGIQTSNIKTGNKITDKFNISLIEQIGNFDIAVYLSDYSLFLSNTDIEIIKYIIKKLPCYKKKTNESIWLSEDLRPLENLFIIKTKSDINFSFSKKDLKKTDSLFNENNSYNKDYKTNNISDYIKKRNYVIENLNKDYKNIPMIPSNHFSAYILKNFLSIKDMTEIKENKEIEYIELITRQILVYTYLKEHLKNKFFKDLTGNNKYTKEEYLEFLFSRFSTFSIKPEYENYRTMFKYKLAILMKRLLNKDNIIYLKNKQ